MEKEICILKNFRNILDATTATDCSELDKAIATIEECMKPKTCDGCKWNYLTKKSFKKCQSKLLCNREYKDRYEPKDNA